MCQNHDHDRIQSDSTQVLAYEGMFAKILLMWQCWANTGPIITASVWLCPSSCIQWQVYQAKNLRLIWISLLWEVIFMLKLFMPFSMVPHDYIIKWKHFLRYWPSVWAIHRSSVRSHHKGQWRGSLMFSLICAWVNGWVNSHEAGDLRWHRTYYDVIVMQYECWKGICCVVCVCVC